MEAVELEVKELLVAIAIGSAGHGPDLVIMGTSENPPFTSWVSITGNNLILLTAIDQMA